MTKQVNGKKYEMKNTEEEKISVVRTKRETNPEEYARLSKARKIRRKLRLQGLKKLGYKPNKKLNKCKRTGKDLKDIKV